MTMRVLCTNVLWNPDDKLAFYKFTAVKEKGVAVGETVLNSDELVIESEKRELFIIGEEYVLELTKA